MVPKVSIEYIVTEVQNGCQFAILSKINPKIESFFPQTAVYNATKVRYAKAYSQTDKQTNRQADRQTDKQTNRQNLHLQQR